MKPYTSALAALLLLGAVGASRAKDAPLFIELPPGTLPLSVGANGFVVVGSFFSGGGLYWMPTVSSQSIGGTQAIAVSLDGKTIAGSALDDGGFENAAIWQGGREWRLLGSIAPDAQPCDRLLSGTFGANDDGRVVVGLAWNGCRIAHAFRWEESTGMVDLGSSVPDRSSRANGVSGDGRVVIGWQENPTGFRQGAKWVGAAQEIIQGPSGFVGEAFAANRDGSLIVGTNCDPLNSVGPPAAWTWTQAEGVRCFPVDRPLGLPAPFYNALMLATSDDGRVIGGAYSFGLESESLVWLDGQVSFLKDYLRRSGVLNAFEGWVNTGFVNDVSPDGRILVGYGAGRRAFQGYMVVLPALGSE